MALIAQSLANLLNGVSQRPNEQRHSSQAEAQKNGFSHLVRGLMKRPPLVYLGKLTGTITGWSTAFVHSINRDEVERYHITIANGDVFAFDALTYAPVTVIAPQGKAYLTDAGNKGFRAATAGDTTIIVNKGTTVKRGAKKTDTAKYEALVYIRQADYATTYQVTLNDVPVAIKTVAAATAQSRESLSTEKITIDLYTALKAEPLLASFTFTRYGSTIHIIIGSLGATDFRLAVFDGLSDKGLKAVKSSVQAFADLPRKAPNGFVVEVAGDPESPLDNYWVKFDDKGNTSLEGVWRECAKPGTLTALDKTTLPHRLVRSGHFVQSVPHVSPTVLPPATVTDGGSATGISTVPWTLTTPGDVSIPAGTRASIRDHNAGVKLTLANGATRLTVPYTIDTALMGADTIATVTFYKNSVSQGVKTHVGGGGKPFIMPPVIPGTDFGTGDLTLLRPTTKGEGAGSFDISGTFATNDVIEMKLTYSGGATPDQYRRAYFTPGDLTVIATGRRVIRFNAADTFPIGATVTATVDGNAFNYNVAGTPKTGTEVAAALQASIDAHASLIAVLGTPTSWIIVSNTSNTIPTLVMTITFSDPTVFNNPTLSLVTNEHNGRTLKNLTDRSQGTVQSNTAQTITVDALTGGVDNKFKSGDLVEIVGSGKYFVFEPCPWNDRVAGDVDVVPFPSFIDNVISDTTFYQNRLVFTSGENVVFSSAGDLFNFFRYTAAQLLADDVIDVRASRKEVALFHSLVLWNGALYGVSDNGVWELSGDPVLTPTTIRIDLVSSIPNTPGPKPVVNGNVMYLTRGKGGFTQVSEFFVTGSTGETVDSVNITEDVPKYIKGKPLAAVGDDTLGFLALLTDADGQKNLYIYSTRFSDDNNRSRGQSSWSKWEFATGPIVGLDIVDGKLGVITVRADGAFLETIDLNVALDSPTSDEGLLYLDRRVDQTTTGVSSVYSAGPDTTTWTIPFNVATNGTEGTLVVVNRGIGLVLASSRPAANQIRTTGQGDLTGASVFIGVLYEFRYKPSRIYARFKDEVPETRGRLTLRMIDVLYHDTTDFDVVITLVGRNPITYSFKVAALALPTSGRLTVPILSKNENATIELVNFSPGVCAFSSLDWEGDFSMRDRRI